MLHIGNCLFLQCCCGCGMITAKLKVHPGAKRPKYWGYVTGHEGRPNVSRVIIDAEYLKAKRRTDFLVATALSQMGRA